MNLIDVRQRFIQDQAHKQADLMDGAAYAYINNMIRVVEAKGDDPTEYEVVMCRDEFPQYTDDKLLVTQRIRLVKREDIKDLPVVGTEI